MKLKSILIAALFFTFKVATGQSYFDLFYSNIPKSEIDKFSSLNSKALGWIQTGNYTFPSACSSCADYSRNSTLTKEKLDSLVDIYKKIKIKEIYATQYIPNNEYLVTDKKANKPYIIKTLFKITGNNPAPVNQIKMTFYKLGNNDIGIENIEIINSPPFLFIDPKIVMSSYKLKLKEDLNDAGPPIEN